MLGVKQILRKILNLVRVLVVISCTIVSYTIVYASSIQQEKTVIFLFDASGSMKTNDPEKLALDSAMQLIYSLPSDYKVGVVAYSNDIVLQKGLVENEKRDIITKSIKAINYSEYSNAAIGLKSALDMVGNNPNSHIVMLSDGEILLNTDQQTIEAKKLFLEEVNRGKDNGTKVHFIALADETLIDSDIAEVAQKTGGSFHYAIGAKDIQSAIDEILTQELKIYKSSLGTTNTKEGVSDININLIDGSKKSKIMITSTTDITDLVADFEANNVIQDLGERYAFLELINPITKDVNLQIKARDSGKVNVSVIPEFQITVNSEINYTDTIPDNKDAAYYDRVANIKLIFTNHEGKLVLKQDVFKDKLIKVVIDGEEITLPIKNGLVNFERKVEKSEEISAKINLNSLPFYVYDMQDIHINLEGAPQIEIEEINIVPYIVAAFSIGIIIVMIIVLRKRKSKIMLAEKEIEEQTSKYSYTGKLNIYITKTKSDIDFTPLTFNLFHISNSRKVSLYDILQKLEVEEELEGANKIYFNPSSNRKLIVTNNSDCTIMRNREIVLKGKSIELVPEGKLDIAFEDEVSELVLQYKDVK